MVVEAKFRHLRRWSRWCGSFSLSSLSCCRRRARFLLLTLFQIASTGCCRDCSDIDALPHSIEAEVAVRVVVVVPWLVPVFKWCGAVADIVAARNHGRLVVVFQWCGAIVDDVAIVNIADVVADVVAVGNHCRLVGGGL